MIFSVSVGQNGSYFVKNQLKCPVFECFLTQWLPFFLTIPKTDILSSCRMVRPFDNRTLKSPVFKCLLIWIVQYSDSQCTTHFKLKIQYLDIYILS